MKYSFVSVLLLILLPLLVFFHTRGIIIHDEGYILNSSQKLLEGLAPYRDFHFVYTPGSLYPTALSFLILEPSVLTSRILMIIVSLVTSFIIYKTVILATRNNLYSTIAVLLYVGWGPTHVNFSWPVMFAIPVSVATCWSLLKFLDSKRERYLYLSGVFAFTVFLFKQNFGLAILISSLIFFLTVKNSRKIISFLSFAYGYAWSFIIFSVYLLQTNSFAPFVNDMYFFTVRRILIDSRLTTHFLYQDSPLNMIVRTTFYLLPVILSIMATVLIVIRKRYHLIVLPIFIILFYIAGIRPTTDYVHLVPLLSLIGIPIALYLRLNINMTSRILVLFFAFIMVILGFQTALFKGYYRWDTPLAYQNNFFNDSRINVFIDDKLNTWFGDFKSTVDRNTRPSDFIFVNSYNPMVYFITKRREPTKNNILTTEIDPQMYYGEVLGALVGKKVPLLILDAEQIDNLPISQYIKENYFYLKNIGNFDVYKRTP